MMQTNSAAIRLPRATYERVHNLAAARHESMSAFIAALVEEYERAAFFVGLEADFAALRADTEAWKSYQDEVAVFDGALSDGLENEPKYEDDRIGS